MALGDLQEEPSAGKPHARICEGESRMAELLDHPPLHLRVPHSPTERILDLEDALVHLAKSDVTVVDVPDAVADFFESNVLPFEQMRERHSFACPSEAAVAAHEPLLVVSGILDRREIAWELAR